MDPLTKRSSINWFAYLVVGIISAVLLMTFYRWAYDDPFISYRYAENLTRGLGFVYNPGERILSTTTPLFTFLWLLRGWYHLIFTCWPPVSG